MWGAIEQAPGEYHNLMAGMTFLWMLVIEQLTG
jgi:hypothetical protein